MAWTAVLLSVGCAVAAADQDPAAGPVAASARPLPDGAREVPQLRTQRSTTWALPSGSYVTRSYQRAVNYLDDRGGWQPIQNRLVASKTAGWHNEANRYAITLPQRLSDGPVRIADGSRWVGFQLQGSDATGTVAGNTATFANAASGVTASWSAFNTSIKEDLTLRDAQAQSRFTFALTASTGLTPSANKAGGVQVRDGSGQVAFAFQAPYAVDANNVRAPRGAVTLSLARSASGATLTVAVDPRWLASAKRAFPVTVDPSAYSTAAQDCYLDGEAATTSYCSDPDLWVGWSDDGTLHDHRSLLRFDGLADCLPAPAELVHARLYMYETGQTHPGVDKNLSAHKITADWTNDANWDDRTASSAWTHAGGDFDSDPADTQPVGSVGDWMSWTLTDLAQSWIDDSADNHGVAIIDDSDNVPNAITFASADASDPASWPFVELQWLPRTGELSGYTMDAHRLSDKSTAKVNVANGNLLIDNQDLHIAGRNGMDVDIHRYFNSLDQFDAKLGWGWRFNVSEDIVLHDCDLVPDHPATPSKCLIGPSGYHARFRRRPDGSYISPPGVEKTLVHNGDGTWTLTAHRSGEKWHFFDQDYTFQTDAVDRHGNEIDYQIDPVHGLDDIHDTRGRDVSVSWNGDDDATQLEDSSGRDYDYAYVTGKRLLQSVTNPDGQTTSYGYDTQDRLQTITDARGSDTTIGYDTDNRVHTVTRQIDNTRAHDLTTTYDYGTADATCDHSGEIGNTVITDPRGKTVTYCWNRDGRVLRTLDGLGYEQSRTYTPNGDSDSYTDLTGTAAATATLHYDLDGSDSTNNLTGGDLGAGEHFDVDYCDPAASSGPTQCSSYAQHAYQPIDVKGPDQDRYFGYNATGDLTSVKDDTTSPTNQATLAYNTSGADTDGTLKTATDGNGHVTTFGYDTDGQLTSISPETITGTNALEVTSYGYDSLSRVASVTDGRHASAGHEISDIDYDGEDRITKITFGDASWISYGYDANGNEISRSDSASHASSYSYDRSNRRSSETIGGATTTYGYDASGNLASITDASGTVGYGYDDANRVHTITQPDSSQITVDYSGPSVRPRWTKLTFPGGVNQTTTTDKSGKTSSIVVKNSGSSTLRSLDYDYLDSGSTQRSQIQTVTDENGNVTTYTYDTVGRLHQAETKTSGGTLIDRWTYTYDNASNRTRVVHTTSGGTTTTSYGYNNDNVLCWSYNGTSTNTCGSPPAGAATYSSDASGNRTAGPSSFNAGYDIANRLTSLGTTALGYLSPTNAELVSIGSTTLTNNLLGLASQTTSGSTTSYTRAPDGTLLAQREPSGTQYVINDILGSTRGLFTATSTNIDRDYNYDPDGNATSTGTGATTAIKFAGGRDVGSGLYHFGQRYYDPSTARWTQPDPIRTVADLQQANLFAYSGGDPANLTDPSGNSLLGKVVTGLSTLETGAVSIGLAFGAAGACEVISGGTLTPVCGVVAVELAGASALSGYAAYREGKHWYDENLN